MNIDTEKMRVAVLAECERICPNDEDTFEVTINGLDCTITGRHHHGISGFDIRETGFFKRRIYQIRSSDDGNWWHLYYIFLGLSERDAVAEKQKTNDYLVERIDKAEWKVAELKASLNTAQQMYTDLLVGTTDAIAAKDAEIKRLRDALIDIEDDAHAKMVLDTPINTKSILMSARHGLGIDSEMIHPLNEDQE